MKKLLLGCLLLAIGVIGTLDAAVYKGQREYVKKCRSCHGDGQKLVSEREIVEWQEMMTQKGAGLAAIHLESDEAKDSWEYFESRKYEKKVKHLLDFMEEYASDSGNVPACN